MIVPTDSDGLMESDLLSDYGKRRMLNEMTIPPRLEDSDESLASFVRRRFGSEALEIFGESLLSGIFTGDPEKLSIQATFPNYVELEKTHGSLMQGTTRAAPPPPDPDLPPTMFVSLRTGMIELVERLQTYLTGDVRTGQAVGRIDADRTIYTSTGEHFRPDAVIVTTPAYIARQIVEPAVPELAELLGTIRTISSGTVTFGFKADEVQHPLDGYGFVIPHTEPTRILACTWNSTKLPNRAPEGHVLLRVFIGGHGRESDVNSIRRRIDRHRARGTPANHGDRCGTRSHTGFPLAQRQSAVRGRSSGPCGAY